MWVAKNIKLEKGAWVLFLTPPLLQVIEPL